jgi:hypothetical protein
METRRARVTGTAPVQKQGAVKARSFAQVNRPNNGDNVQIRTTRAQQLRSKKILENKIGTGNRTAPKRERIELKAPELVEVDENVEEMEISLSEDAKKEEIDARNKILSQIEIKDDSDKADDYLVGHYVNNIYEYLRYLEVKYQITPRYLDASSEVSSKMRSILVDWLVQVHKRFKLMSDTLYLTVGLLDRYLSNCDSIKKNEMQLIGITCLMIACKAEEILCPEIDDYVYICDNAYTSEQILSMELEVFRTLEFNVGQPMSINFLRRYSNMGGVEGQQHAMAKYFLELALVDYDLMSIKPSIISAAALNLSLHLLGDESWSPILEHYSGYSNDDLKHVVNLICKALYSIEFTKTGIKLSAVKKKYSDPKQYEISRSEVILKNKNEILEKARAAKSSLQH